MTAGEERTRWKIRGDRVIEENPRVRLSVASVELDPNETEAVRWISLAELPGLIATGEISGAATIIGAQHVLLTVQAKTLA